jgi:hypothetical protein
MTTLVFLGPSLPLAEARRALPDALFLPPAAMGDVLRAVQRHRPAVLALIDGLFEQTPAVWHKEILYAMAQGVVVFGGGSMGALRAAELAPFGMRGVGHTFEDFAAGRLEDDDEVAITHLPAGEGYRSLCEPMVNLRHGLALGCEQGLLDAQAEQALVAAMKRLHYPERSWPVLFEHAARLGLPPHQVQLLEAFVGARRPDRKAEDAQAVLAAVRKWQGGGSQAPAAAAAAAPRLRFEPTVFWDHLVADHGHTAEVSRVPVAHERLIDYVRLGIPDRQGVLDEALRRVLAQRVGREMGLPPVDDDEALVRFRRSRGLLRPAALSAWMQAQGLDPQQCLELARDEERERRLHWRLQEQVSREIPRVLQRRGRLGEVAEGVRSQRSRLQELGIHDPQQGDIDSLDAALQWYDRTWGPVHSELQQHIVERGFGSPRQFMAELLARYLATGPVAPQPGVDSAVAPACKVDNAAPAATECTP